MRYPLVEPVTSHASGISIIHLFEEETVWFEGGTEEPTSFPQNFPLSPFPSLPLSVVTDRAKYYWFLCSRYSYAASSDESNKNL